MTLTRRQFLRRSALAGSGLLLSTFVPELARAQQKQNGSPFEPNLYLRVNPDGTATITVIHHEMGQGVRTVLPMLVAEDLEVDWSQVRIEQAVTGPRFQGVRLHTSGSSSSTRSYLDLRRAGATARDMLVAAAAAQWGVAADACRAEHGAVIHAATGRKLGYGELTSAAAKQPVPSNPRLKEASEFRLIGKPMRRVDGPDIVTGRALYGLDVRRPGMVFASIERAPVLGAKLVRYDDAVARARPGVLRTMPVRSGIQQGVAVVATSSWAAFQARRALKIEWDLGAHREFDSDQFIAGLERAFAQDAFKVRWEGDAPAALTSAAQRHEATYVLPFQAHAPLEIMNCTADVRANVAEFWAPTQTQHRCMQQAVRVTGLTEDKIKIHAVLMGGGFGRRLYADYLAEAAEISRVIGKPVQVVWTREDDTRHGYFQPCTAERLRGGLDASGHLVALSHLSTECDLTINDIHEGRDMYSGAPRPPKAPNAFADEESPWGAFDNPYVIPNLKVDAVNVASPVPHGPWRAVEYPSTVFGRESFLDEMAHLAGADPLRFRLDHLRGGVREIGSHRIDPARLARVHELAAERAAWGTPFRDDGRLHGRGIAASVYHGGSYIAQVVEVSVAKDLSDVRVHRVVAAIDCGLVLNPLGAIGQAESGITWGLSYALKGKIDFRKGRAVQRGYGDFTVMRMDDMPATEIHLVESAARPGGLGEHAVPMVAPAVANAVFAATGRRVRQLPITAESLRAAGSGGG